HACLPRRPAVDGARAAAGRRRQPALVPDHVEVASGGPSPVRRVEAPVSVEGDVALRVPRPAVLKLRSTDRGDIRARRGPAVDGEAVRRRVAVLLRDAEAPGVARRGEERVALRDPLLEDGVELGGLALSGTAERLLGDA